MVVVEGEIEERSIKKRKGEKRRKRTGNKKREARWNWYKKAKVSRRRNMVVDNRKGGKGRGMGKGRCDEVR